MIPAMPPDDPRCQSDACAGVMSVLFRSDLLGTWLVQMNLTGECPRPLPPGRQRRRNERHLRVVPLDDKKAT